VIHHQEYWANEGDGRSRERGLVETVRKTHPGPEEDVGGAGASQDLQPDHGSEDKGDLGEKA
jgi:hypothetical protein